MSLLDTHWILCPVCRGKTRTQIREDTVPENFPLFCPKCRQESIINATSTEAIPDLLRAAAEEGADRLVVRVSYFSTDRAGVEQMVRDVQEEKDGGRDAGMLAAPWQVSFYPDTDEPGIVEILLK